MWENVDTGLLAGVGQKVTALDQIQVDQSGQIFIPYAGRMDAMGKDPDTLRRDITAALEGQTPDPQVEVRRIAGDGATVSVLGAVSAQGVYPIEAPTRRLSAMIAQAGGVAILPDIALVRLQRGGRSGQIWLQDLYDNPALDVALRAGDRIIVEQDRRSFTALGASGDQARIPFTKRDMTAIEALGEAGGLDGQAADPTGVFVFRLELADVANRATGRTDLVGHAAHGLYPRPDQPRGNVLGARIHHPRRGHGLHHRGPLRCLEPPDPDRHRHHRLRRHRHRTRALSRRPSATRTGGEPIDLIAIPRQMPFGKKWRKVCQMAN